MIRLLRRTPAQSTGDAAEQAALHFLEHQGLTLVQRNFRCKTGEIDLIMRDGTTLVFVEVRFRQSSRFGDGAASVTWRKQQRLIRAAQHYLQRSRQTDRLCRFDVLSAARKDGAAHHSTDAIQFDWIKNAIDSF